MIFPVYILEKTSSPCGATLSSPFFERSEAADANRPWRFRRGTFARLAPIFRQLTRQSLAARVNALLHFLVT